MDYLGSMYIDNELDLEEKVQFIEKIHSEQEFYQQTVDLLVQEKQLRTVPEKLLIPVETRIRFDLKNWFGKIFRPLVYAGAGFAFASLVLFTEARARRLATSARSAPGAAMRTVKSSWAVVMVVGGCQAVRQRAAAATVTVCEER